MNTLSKILIAGLILFCFSSCDNYDQFEEELYKKEIYLMSGDNNFFSVVCDLDTEKSEHNVSLGSSGTQRLDQDVTIELERDTILMRKYNYSNFELDSTKYIRTLDDWRYNFPSMTATIQAKSKDVYGLLPFRIEPENLIGLSPDSVYVIPIAIKNTSAYSVKKEKFNALIRIFTKNKYAETIQSSTYGMKGYQGNSMEDAGNSMGSNKVLLPLTANSVRFYVGLQNPPSEPVADDIYRVSGVITIHDDMTVSVAPYNSAAQTLEIETLTPPSSDPNFLWTNTYEELPPEFLNGKISQRFLLFYKYRIKDKGSNNWGSWIYAREILNRIYI